MNLTREGLFLMAILCGGDYDKVSIVLLRLFHVFSIEIDCLK